MGHEDDMGLTARVAVVTGAGSAGDGIGNGRAAAILLARAGAYVVAVDRDAQRAQRTADMIRSEGGEATSISADITNETDCHSIVQTTCSHYGSLHILDNNVGIGSRATVVDEAVETWDEVMNVNVRSMFLMCKVAIPVIASCGGGAIINISSISALRPRGLTTYTTSKGAVIALTKAMAVDHATDGIRVNCVAPGPVYTPMVIGQGMADDLRERRKQASALKVEGTAWDIGNAVVFLASQRARYITGQTLIVDGGVTLRAPDR